MNLELKPSKSSHLKDIGGKGSKIYPVVVLYQLSLMNSPRILNQLELISMSTSAEPPQRTVLVSWALPRTIRLVLLFRAGHNFSCTIMGKLWTSSNQHQTTIGLKGVYFNMRQQCMARVFATWIVYLHFNTLEPTDIVSLSLNSYGRSEYVKWR